MVDVMRITDYRCSVRRAYYLFYPKDPLDHVKDLLDIFGVDSKSLMFVDI